MSRLTKNIGDWHPQVAYCATLSPDVVERDYHGAGLGYATVDINDGFLVTAVRYAPETETFENEDGSEDWKDDSPLPKINDGKVEIRCRLGSTQVVITHGTAEAALLNALKR